MNKRSVYWIFVIYKIYVGFYGKNIDNFYVLSIYKLLINFMGSKRGSKWFYKVNFLI